jgi:hypothetical protein
VGIKNNAIRCNTKQAAIGFHIKAGHQQLGQVRKDLHLYNAGTQQTAWEIKEHASISYESIPQFSTPG